MAWSLNKAGNLTEGGFVEKRVSPPQPKRLTVMTAGQQTFMFGLPVLSIQPVYSREERDRKLVNGTLDKPSIKSTKGKKDR